jgi:hypothetical protein
MTLMTLDTNIARHETAAAGSSATTSSGPTAINRWRRFAWISIVVADAGFVAWGVMAAVLPQYLPGPGGTPILTAGYEGFTQSSWSELVVTSPATASFITLVFRLFGALCATFGIMGVLIAATAFRRGERWAWWALLVGNTVAYGAPMTYDRLVHAIGLFEMSEYLGIALIYLALAVTAPLARSGHRGASVRLDSVRRL